jgi:hypothetical protein
MGFAYFAWLPVYLKIRYCWLAKEKNPPMKKEAASGTNRNVCG